MNQGQPTVLILDESPVLTLQLQRQLMTLGYTATSLVPIAGFHQQLPHNSVVFVELMLSQNNGFQLIRALANLPHVSLFLLTGTKRSTDLQWGLCAGAKAVLKRPLTLAVLRNALQSLQLLPIPIE